MKKLLILAALMFVVCSGSLYPASASWMTTITATGSASDVYTVNIGIGAPAVLTPAPPTPPPSYSVEMVALDATGENRYATFVQAEGQSSYLWILGVNPKGNVGGLGSRTSTLSWNSADLGAGDWQLRADYTGTGDILVADMKTTTSYLVTGGNAEYYFTLNFTPSAVPIPSAILLLAPGLAGLVGVRIRKHRR